MASLGRRFRSSKNTFSADEVIAFFSGNNDDSSDSDNEAMDVRDSGRISDQDEGSRPGTTEPEVLSSSRVDSCGESSFQEQEQPNEVMPIADESICSPVQSSSRTNDCEVAVFEESIGTENELSILHHQMDDSLTTHSAHVHGAFTPSSNSDIDSESDESSVICTLESPESETDSSTASTDQDDASEEHGSGHGRGREGHRVGESSCEQDCGSVRGRGRGRVTVRGRGQSRGRGVARGRGSVRGRGRGRGSGSVRGRRRGRGARQGHTREQGSISLPKTACDISITDQHFKEAPAFSPNRTPGPHLPPNTDISALGLFELYFDDAVITHAVESTNVYAEEKKEKERSMYKRFKFKELDNGEMMRFITALLLLGITGVRSYRKAWSTKSAQSVVRLSELMSRNRFEAISSFFHMVTPEEERESAGNPLHKILYLHKHMKTKCTELYQPLQQISVDERMVRSRARTKFRQYLKDKPVKWGFKYWVMSDPSGYTCDFNLYCGAQRTVLSRQGLAFDVVTELVSPLHGQNYQLFCDNFYSGPELFTSLLAHGITATGTLRTNRKGVPGDVLTIKTIIKHNNTPRGKGYYIREKDSPIVYCCWNDNQVVTAMSTSFPGHSMGTVNRKAKNTTTGAHQVCAVKIPHMIEMYNKYMGGVDKSDQLLRYHSSSRRATRYWKTMFYHLLDVAVTNAFVIYNWVNMEQGKKACSENTFRDALILQLIEKYRRPHSQTATATSPLLAPEQCRVRHGSTLGTQQARCSYCYHHGITSWTTRRCTDCSFVPALCQTTQRDCHAAWHSLAFDIARSLWFSRMLGRGNRPVFHRKRPGRPVGVVSRNKRRGNYRSTSK